MTAPLPTAAPEDVGLSSSALHRLSSAITDRVASGHVPGAVALVARHGKVAYFEAFGRRDPAGDAPMTTDAIFRIYSMTKAIVSVGVMMLWEEGRLLLGDPIGKYLPALGAVKVGVPGDGTLRLVETDRPITVQDLLRHTSGLTYEFRGSSPVHKAYVEASDRPPAPDQRGACGDTGHPATAAPAGDAVGIQPLHRRARPADRGGLRPEPRHLPVRAHPGPARHGGHRVLGPEERSGPHRRTLCEGSGERHRRRAAGRASGRRSSNPAAAAWYPSTMDYARFLAMLLGNGRLGETGCWAAKRSS